MTDQDKLLEEHELLKRLIAVGEEYTLEDFAMSAHLISMAKTRLDYVNSLIEPVEQTDHGGWEDH